MAVHRGRDWQLQQNERRIWYRPGNRTNEETGRKRTTTER